MLGDYDSESEDAGGAGVRPGEGSEGEDGPSETARLLAEVLDPARAEAGAPDPALADCGAAGADDAQDPAAEEGASEEASSEGGGAAEGSSSAAGGAAEDSAGEDSDDGGAGGAPRRLPSAGQAFSMVDKKDIEKYRPKKRFEVKSFKKEPARRAAPTGPLTSKGGVGTISSVPMPAGLRAAVEESASREEDPLSAVDDDRKRQALEAMGLIDGAPGGGGSGGGRGAGKGKGKDHLLPRSAGGAAEREPEAALKRARVAAAEASGDAGPLRKGHILGLAADEVARARAAASLGLE